jgi:hypothetical protein
MQDFLAFLKSAEPLFTCLLSLGTIALAIFTLMLFRATRAAALEAEKYNARLLDENKRLANAAELQAETTKTSLEKLVGASIASTTTAQESLKAAKDLSERQIQLSQRQMIVELWDYISNLSAIDCRQGKTVGPDVTKALNTLELIAICCEGGMVDKEVIKRTFREPFMELFEQIADCMEIPGRDKNGRRLLDENHATVQMYEELKTEERNRYKTAPV